MGSQGGIAGGTMGTIITVLVTNLLLSIGIMILQTPFADVVTDETSFSCTAGTATASTCSLSPSSFYRGVNETTGVRQDQIVPNSKIPGLSIKASEGSITSSTLNADGTEIKIVGTSLATTGVAATGSYRAANDNDLRALWLALPMIAIVGGVTGLFAMASSVSLQGQGTGRIMSGIVALIVGASLVTVQNQFVNNAQNSYAATPEFIGLDAIWILLELSFVFIILAIAFGLVSGNSVFGYAKSKLSKKSKKAMNRSFSMGG